MEWLHGKEVELIPLDKEHITGLYKYAKGIKNEDLRLYLMTVVRERSWRNRINAMARPGDFVVMHPAHLARVIRTWRVPENRFLFVDKVKREVRPLLDPAFDRRLKQKRKSFIRQHRKP